MRAVLATTFRPDEVRAMYALLSKIGSGADLHALVRLPATGTALGKFARLLRKLEQHEARALRGEAAQ